jgi:protein-disulfide isomerase
MHPFACSLARLGVCAQAKNRFWDYHDKVFMDVEDADLVSGWDNLRSKLSSIFTSEEFDNCLQSDSSLMGVKQNIQEGIDLEIKGTPATFVNGRTLSIPLDFETLKKLIDLEKS